MNISRYANIDKFLNIRYILFFTNLSGIQLIISASPSVEITSPGRRARGFFNPCQKQEWPMAAMFVNRSEQNEQS
jgi:hypothetical protein